MSPLIENYRRKGPAPPAIKASRRRTYAVAAVALVLTVGCAVLWTVVPAMPPAGRAAAAAPLLRSSAAQADITNSDTPMGAAYQPPSPSPDEAEWTAMAYVLGVSALAGTLVFLAISFVWPGRSKDDPQAPRSRTPAGRKLEDVASDRRWHGGPIRN